MIPVVYLPPEGNWDQNIVHLLLENKLWDTKLEFEVVPSWPEAFGIVLVIPGRFWNTMIESDIVPAIQQYEWVLALRTSDEEDWFDISKVEHPNIKWWVQTPRTDREYGDARFFGVGFTPHFNDLPAETPTRSLDWFLAGQRTHERRQQAFNAVRRIRPRGEDSRLFLETEGFTQGYHPGTYAGHMQSAKVAPAPSGAISPDSFRFYEALESHAVPIADDISPVYNSKGFWQMLFPDLPIPVLTDYRSLPGYIRDIVDHWPRDANRTTAWWMQRKREMSRWLIQDLTELGAI